MQSEIKSRIYTVRGKEVMLDEDLMFQLSEKEYENLRSQIVTSSSSHGGRRYLPYVFTELGVYMLSSVLKSKVAIEVSIEVMRTFAKIREFSLHYNALAKQIMEL